MGFLYRFILLISAVIALQGLVQAQTPPRPAVAMWLGPPRADSAFVDPASPAYWPETYNAMSVYKAYYTQGDSYTSGQAQAFLSKLRTDNKKLAIEVGGFYPAFVCQSNHRLDPYFYNQATMLPRLGAAGADAEGSEIASKFGTAIDYLVIDGPFARIFDHTSYPNDCQTLSQGVNLEFAVNELVTYMQAMRQRFPAVKFALLTNFPNWNFTTPGGAQTQSTTGVGTSIWDINPQNGSTRILDYRDVLNAAKNAVSSAGMQFEMLQIDNPYNYVDETGWQRISGLVSQAQGLGIQTGLITNWEPGQSGTSQQFYDQSVAYSSAASNTRTIPVNAHIVQSWYTVPTELRLESTPYSMTATSRDIWFGLRNYNEPIFGVTGYIDGIANGNLVGWACGKYNTSSIYVHLFVGGPATSGGTFAGAYFANASSEAAVATACKSTGTQYRFQIPVTNRWPVGTALYLHGISPIAGFNNLLPGSGSYVSP